MRSGRSPRPVCPRHPETQTLRDLKERWFCPDCANERLQRQVDDIPRSAGGVELPAGVKDVRQVADFRDILPNRAARRRARRYMK